MAFGQILTQLRTEKGVYQKELADYLNVTIGTISNYENNIHNPDLKSLCMLADYFGVTTDFLLERTAYRHNLDTLNQKITVDCTISEFVNTTLELTPQNRRSLLEYIELLKLRNTDGSGNSKKKKKRK